MTDAYRQGFLTKCAEHGVPLRVADGMLKYAKLKLPTSRETVIELIKNLKENGLRKVKFSDLFKSRPKFTMFRGSNALPAHAHQTPAAGTFKRNIHNGVRYEHYTPFPDEAHSYGKFLTMTDVSGYKPLMSGAESLSRDFSAMDAVRHASSTPSKAKAARTKLVLRNSDKISELSSVDWVGDTPRLSMSPSGGLRDSSFEAVIPARYADKHSRVFLQPESYPIRLASIENGGRVPVPDSIFKQTAAAGLGMDNQGALNLTALMTNNPDYFVYDLSPVQRLAKIMHRHPEYKDLIEPEIKRYLSIGESGMAGL